MALSGLKPFYRERCAVNYILAPDKKQAPASCEAKGLGYFFTRQRAQQDPQIKGNLTLTGFPSDGFSR